MNRLRLLFLSAAILAGLVGSIINATAEERYEAMVQVMVKRAQLERANGATEDSKNRWVWVRDGMELKNQLVSDDVLARILTASNTANETSLANFRKAVNVHYSGGDDNLYTIRVKSDQRNTAISLANRFLMEFGPLTVDTRTTALIKSIETIESQPLKTDDDVSRGRRAEILETLRADLAFSKAENDHRIVVVSKASDAKRIWPRPLFIYTAAALLSFFLASLVAVSFRIFRN